MFSQGLNILKHFRNAPFYILLFLPHGRAEDIFWSYFMSLHNEQELSHDSIACLNCALPITKTRGPMVL